MAEKPCAPAWKLQDGLKYDAGENAAEDCGKESSEKAAASVSTGDQNRDSYAGPLPSVVAGAPISACPASRYLGDLYNIPDFSSPKFKGNVSYASSSSEFLAAINRMSPGDVVVLRDGVYQNVNVALGANHSGTDQAPKYILSESIHGAVLAGNSRFSLNDTDYLVVAGFRRPNALSELGVGKSSSKYVRYACNLSDHKRQASQTAINISRPSGYSLDVTSDIEIDNNVSVNLGRQWLNINQCGYYNYSATAQSCLANPHRFYLHNNRILSDERGVIEKSGGIVRRNEYFLYTGVGWSHAFNENRYPGDVSTSTRQGIDEMDVIFENNHVKWIQTNSTKSADIKSSRGIYRYNCLENTTPAFRVRTGDNNLAYGNWYRGTARGNMEVQSNGQGNYRVFNFFENMKGAPGASFFRTQRFSDRKNYDFHAYAYESKSNTFSHNVMNNSNTWVRWRSLSLPDPSGALPATKTEQHGIFSNKIYNTSGNVVAYDLVQDSNSVDSIDQVEFQALNPGWTKTNIVATPELQGSPACFTPGHVKGIAGSVKTHRYVLEGIQVIEAPSWW